MQPATHSDGFFVAGPHFAFPACVQSCVKVIADTDVRCYHMHIGQFIKHAPPELLR